VWLQYQPSPKRKLAYSWEFTETTGGYIGVNTLRANHLVAEALAQGLITQLRKYEKIRREVRFGEASRVDFLLQHATLSGEERCWLEVKNATYRCGEVISFPDARTSRGVTHLRELSAASQRGERAVLLYVVNRPDGRGFQALPDLDPAYFQGMREAQKVGVEFLAYRVEVKIEGEHASMEVSEEVPWIEKT
jgi:sugar fermentation stimulation protein A